LSAFLQYNLSMVDTDDIKLLTAQHEVHNTRPLLFPHPLFFKKSKGLAGETSLGRAMSYGRLNFQILTAKLAAFKNA